MFSRNGKQAERTEETWIKKIMETSPKFINPWERFGLSSGPRDESERDSGTIQLNDVMDLWFRYISMSFQERKSGLRLPHKAKT